MLKTTDPQDELFYQVDEKDNVIGSVTRAEAHKDRKIIHRSIHILLFNSKGEILLQKRSLTKDKYPGSWCDAVAGHVDYGSDYLATAIREAKEELNIVINPDDLIELTKLLIANQFESEYVTFYKLQIDKETLDFEPNKEEISSISFFSIDQIKKMLADPNEEFVPTTKIIFEKIF